MNKLEDDYTYISLQGQLANLRYRERIIKASKSEIMRHINAIKRDYYQYEMEMKNG